MNTLKTDSNIYYKNSQIYDNFSQAQDYGDLIIQEISKIVKGDVLDFGCGTGKIILKLLEKNLDISLTGLDISENQLDILRNKIPTNKYVNLICYNSNNLPFTDNTFDFVISSWVLGTVEDNDKRDLILKELKRILKKNGLLILIENWHNDEFEKIIRGVNLINKIDSYDFGIKKNNFKIYKQLETKFHFKELITAKEIFSSIWNKTVAARIQSNEISHLVRIYILINN